MKQNTFTKLLATGAACIFALGTAFAQDSTTTTTTAAGSTAVSTSTMDGTGTITTFSPDGNTMTLRTSTGGEPTMYYYTPQTVVVDPTGATVQLSALRPDMPVSYTYAKEGDRMVVTKVTLQKPITYYEKTTTTTTTNP
jgi:Tol biopolymer transport system component